jgi:hypothetical protein
MLYAITLFALIVSPLVSAQRCYVAMPDFSGSSNCTAPPFYTRVDIATASTCEHSYCQNVTRNGLQGESGGKSVPTVEEIPKPLRYIELRYYTDAQCLNIKRMEYYAIATCGLETSNNLTRVIHQTFQN